MSMQIAAAALVALLSSVIAWPISAGALVMAAVRLAVARARPFSLRDGPAIGLILDYLLAAALALTILQTVLVVFDYTVE